MLEGRGRGGTEPDCQQIKEFQILGLGCVGDGEIQAVIISGVEEVVLGKEEAVILGGEGL